MTRAQDLHVVELRRGQLIEPPVCWREPGLRGSDGRPIHRPQGCEYQLGLVPPGGCGAVSRAGGRRRSGWRCGTHGGVARPSAVVDCRSLWTAGRLRARYCSSPCGGFERSSSGSRSRSSSASRRTPRLAARQPDVIVLATGARRAGSRGRPATVGSGERRRRADPRPRAVPSLSHRGRGGAICAERLAAQGAAAQRPRRCPPSARTLVHLHQPRAQAPYGSGCGS